MTRIVSASEAEELLASGWKKADLHVHTTASHDVMPMESLDPKAQYEYARKAGLHFVTFTDHDTMAAYDTLGDQPGLVRGVEVTIFDQASQHTFHVNVFTLSDEQFARIQLIRQENDIYAITTYCKEQALPFMMNHPYWIRKGEKVNEHAIAKAASEFPVIELNMALIRQKNDLAIQLANELGKPLVSGTDSHIGMLGEAYTLAPGDTFAEFWANVAAGNSAVVRRDMNAATLVAEVNVRLDMLFSKQVREEELQNIAAWANERVPGPLVYMLMSLRRFGATRFMMRNSLRSVSKTRVPATAYITREMKTCYQIRQAQKQRVKIVH